LAHTLLLLVCWSVLLGRQACLCVRRLGAPLVHCLAVVFDAQAAGLSAQEAARGAEHARGRRCVCVGCFLWGGRVRRTGR
jgi:hypothetical protein